MVDKDSAFAGSAVEPKSPPRLCRSTARTVEVKNTNKSNSYYALPDLDVVASRDPIEKVRLTSDQSKETMEKSQSITNVPFIGFVPSDNSESMRKSKSKTN